MAENIRRDLCAGGSSVSKSLLDQEMFFIAIDIEDYPGNTQNENVDYNSRSRDITKYWKNSKAKTEQWHGITKEQKQKIREKFKLTSSETRLRTSHINSLLGIRTRQNYIHYKMEPATDEFKCPLNDCPNVYHTQCDLNRKNHLSTFPYVCQEKDCTRSAATLSRRSR